MKKLSVLAVLALAAQALVSPVWAHQGHQIESLEVAAPEHKSTYAEGLYLLHNFEYDRAADAFRRARADDADNVMAYWGEAMTHNHPLWAYQDIDAARAVLAMLGPTKQTRQAKARSAREAAWLNAVETLYGEGSKIERDRAYHEEMMAMLDADPDDVEARSFAGLSTLGLASEGRDTATYMKAAALLEEAFHEHSDHPGVLHYLIHSYDDPAHAPLGLRAARLYASLAPDAGHAQHMVSHIYLALGEWSEVEATNIQATKVANVQRDATGRPNAYCGHYNEWLSYALDQQGKDSQTLVNNCQKQAMAQLASMDDPSVLGANRKLITSWAMIAAHHGVNTGHWPEAVALPEGEHNLFARFDLTYARVLAARSDLAAAEVALADLKRDHGIILDALPFERPDDHESADWYDRAVAQAQAVVTLARGDTDNGLKMLHAAADAEAALPEAFGPPLLAKPSAELLGDEYLALGKTAEAAAAYRRSLAATPKRRLSVIGLKKSTQL